MRQFALDGVRWGPRHPLSTGIEVMGTSGYHMARHPCSRCARFGTLVQKEEMLTDHQSSPPHRARGLDAQSWTGLVPVNGVPT